MSGKPLRIAFLQPQRDAVELKPGSCVSIGRAPDAGLRLEAAQVSSRHATIEDHDGRWTLIDQGSRNGTLLNGSMIGPQVPCELRHGDEISIHPFRLRMDLGGPARMTTMANLSGEEGTANVRAIAESELESMAGRRLRLLIDSAAEMGGAATVPELSTAAARALLQGTGFRRAMVLRGGEGALEVLASETATPGRDEQRVSRSLLRAASAGKPVRLEDSNLSMAESIVGAGVTAAMCIPLLVGESIEAFVYLDSVGGARPGEDAAAFAVGLGRFLSMGLGEVRRRELVDRQRSLEAELSAAHGVQRRLMPADRGTMDGWRWRLHSEPGRVVAGDIVGAGESPAGPWVFLGDVAGKGAAAGMLMASIQAHLASDLTRGIGLVESVSRVNEYVRRHRGDSEFATLFAVRLAPDGSSAEMVDVGHGLAALAGGGEAARRIEAEGGPPLGVADFPYESTRLALSRGHRIVLFSDGVNEQRSAAGEELGVDRVNASLEPGGDVETDVESMMGLLRGHAKGVPFADDVSVISLSFDGADMTRA